jgi:WD40 repeat protein/tetratricopeptide (TPR) repeat protein
MSAAAAAASELKSRRFLYAADVGIAQQCIEENNMGRARQLLDRHRPGPGEIDLRGWEWRYLWQKCRSDALAVLTKREEARAFTVSFSPDGRWLAIGFYDGQVEIWDVAKRQRSKVLKEYSGTRAHVAFSPRGDLLAAALGRNAVKFYNTITGNVSEFCTLSGPVRDLSFSRDGEWLAVKSHQPDLVQILRVDDGSSVFARQLSDAPQGNIFFDNARISPDKKRLYISFGAFRSPKVQCISINDGAVLWETGDVPPDATEPEEWRDVGFRAMDISPDGQTLVVSTGYSRTFARVLDANTGRLLRTLRGHTRFVSDVKFSSDGKWLVTGSSDQSLRVWDASTWEPRGERFRGHNQEVHSIAISADGMLVASGSKDGEVLLWDVHAPRPNSGGKRLPSHIDEVSALPAGEMAICRLVGGGYSLLSLATLEEQAIPPAELSPVDNLPLLADRFFPPSRLPPRVARTGFVGTFSEAVLSPDRKLVAVPSEYGLVALYDPDATQPREILRGSMDTIFCAAFSPDNQRLILSNGGAKGISLWDMTTRQELITMHGGDPLLMTLRISPDANSIIIKSHGRPVEGVGTWQVFRAPSWDEIESAESSAGQWAVVQAPTVPPRPPTLAETKVLVEQRLRETYAEVQAAAEVDPVSRDEALGQLAYFLNRQGKAAEAEPLLRELLTRYEAQYKPTELIVPDIAVTLLQATLRLGRSSTDTQSGEADELVAKILMLLEKRLEIEPRNTRLFLYLAVANAWLGRDAEYLRLSESLLDVVASDSAPPAAKERAACAWCVQPNADPDQIARALSYARRATEAEQAPSARTWLLRAVGMAEYRSANYAAAEEAFLGAAESLDDSTRDARLRSRVSASIQLFRAMIRHRRGEVDEAQKLFALAEKEAPAPPRERRELLGGGYGEQDIIHALAYEEAKSLLNARSSGGEIK